MTPTKETKPIYAQSLRFWQKHALAQALGHKEQFLMWRVTPGGGKTYAALRAALSEFNRGGIESVVVVVPTKGIKDQWIEDAPKLVGLKLASLETWDKSCQGIVTTYQQVSSKRTGQALQGFCSERPTIVILDEIHHASDKNTWGKRIIYALGGAKMILGLTGTPFRSDGKPVPFVRYKDDVCEPDFSYVYKQAWNDDIVRTLQFQLYDGTSYWRRDGQDSQEKLISLASKGDKAGVLAAAFDPASNFAQSMIEGAHTKLLEMEPGSACLLVAKDTKHANALAALLKKVTGVRPVIVHSEHGSDGDARLLKKFKNSSDQWLVSVRMVSEGIDIPRIRVICWMTNYMTQLYFEQLVARGLRGPSSEECWVIMPELQELVKMSFTFTHADLPRLKDGDDGSATGRLCKRPGSIETLGSDGYLSRIFTPIADQLVESRSIVAYSKHKLETQRALYAEKKTDEEWMESIRQKARERNSTPDGREKVRLKNANPKMKAWMAAYKARKRAEGKPELTPEQTRKKNATDHIIPLRKSGYSFGYIANFLNEQNIAPVRGQAKWSLKKVFGLWHDYAETLLDDDRTELETGIANAVEQRLMLKKAESKLRRARNRYDPEKARLAQAMYRQRKKLGYAPKKNEPPTSLIVNLRSSGASLEKIAMELNSRGIKSIKGGLWYPGTVGAILDREQQTANG